MTIQLSIYSVQSLDQRSKRCIVSSRRRYTTSYPTNPIDATYDKGEPNKRMVVGGINVQYCYKTLSTSASPCLEVHHILVFPV